MRPLPVELLNDYRIVTSHIVRSWSFGKVKSASNFAAAEWKQVRGTLQDQAIFGPVRDFECACGKFCGKRYERLICDRCGVKITTASCRRIRFAHVELQVPASHPFGRPTDALQAFPVIPAAFIESIAGQRLGDAYRSLVAASAELNGTKIQVVINEIVEILLPLAVEAQNWNLHDAATLARGLALEHLDEFEEPDDRCKICGYALEGLRVPCCPGCGRQLTG